MTGSLQDRIDALEREVAQLRRLVGIADARPGATSLRGLGRRIERAILDEDLEASGTAEAYLLDQDDVATSRKITVTDLDAWPIAEGKKITVAWRQLPGSEEGIWFPLTAERSSLTIPETLCCIEGELTVCEIEIHPDSHTVPDTECACDEE